MRSSKAEGWWEVVRAQAGEGAATAWPLAAAAAAAPHHQRHFANIVRNCTEQSGLEPAAGPELLPIPPCTLTHLTRGFISMMTISPSSGLMAICTLEPPHSTPISRIMATAASRRRWYSCAAAAAAAAGCSE